MDKYQRAIALLKQRDEMAKKLEAVKADIVAKITCDESEPYEVKKAVKDMQIIVEHAFDRRIAKWQFNDTED